MKQSIMIVGVGGQGTLLAGRLLGEYAKAKGLDAKVSEVHGMAQRGGSVVTHVRIGEKVASPLVDVQSADVLLSFEPVEALRALEMLKPGGVLICDEAEVPPIAVNMGTAVYPEDVKQRLWTQRALLKAWATPRRPTLCCWVYIRRRWAWMRKRCKR